MWLAWWSGGGVVVEWWLSKITKVKEKRLSEDQQPDESHVVPLYKRLVLTTQALTEISDLREPLCCFANFPKPQQYCYGCGNLQNIIKVPQIRYLGKSMCS